MKLRARTAFLCCLVAFCAVCLASGQTRTNSSGNGGIHTISGRIFSPSGRSIDNQIKVKLESNSYAELSLITDQNGGFAFSALAPGAYTVVVDAGEHFEVFRESVVIDPEVKVAFGVVIPPTPKVFSVPVYLRLKRNTAEKTGVVNAKYADAPKDALEHYEKGLALVKKDKVDDALAEFDKAIAIYPALEPAHVEAGKIYLKKSLPDEAINSLKMAVRYDPKDFDAKLNLAIALYNVRRFDESQQEFNEAVTLNASAVWPHYYLGLIYIQKKDLDDAQTQLESAKKLKGEKNIPLIHKYLGGIYMTKRLNSQAVAELEKYVQLSPNAQDADRIRQTIAELKNNKN